MALCRAGLVERGPPVSALVAVAAVAEPVGPGGEDLAPARVAHVVDAEPVEHGPTPHGVGAEGGAHLGDDHLVPSVPDVVLHPGGCLGSGCGDRQVGGSLSGRRRRDGRTGLWRSRMVDGRAHLGAGRPPRRTRAWSAHAEGLCADTGHQRRRRARPGHRHAGAVAAADRPRRRRRGPAHRLQRRRRRGRAGPFPRRCGLRGPRHRGSRRHAHLRHRRASGPGGDPGLCGRLRAPPRHRALGHQPRRQRGPLRHALGHGRRAPSRPRTSGCAAWRCRSGGATTPSRGRPPRPWPAPWCRCSNRHRRGPRST